MVCWGVRFLWLNMDSISCGIRPISNQKSRGKSDTLTLTFLAWYWHFNKSHGVKLVWWAQTPLPLITRSGNKFVNNENNRRHIVVLISASENGEIFRKKFVTQYSTSNYTPIKNYLQSFMWIERLFHCMYSISQGRVVNWIHSP